MINAEFSGDINSECPCTKFRMRNLDTSHILYELLQEYSFNMPRKKNELEIFQ